MEPLQSDPDYEAPELAEQEEPSSPYSWVTFLMGLVLALSMLGSILWRAFPPSLFLNNGSTNPEPSTRLALPLSVAIAATAGWVDTGITLESNTSYRLSTRGQVRLSQQGGFSQMVGPQGFGSRCQEQGEASCLLSGGHYGALVGRVGETDPFHIGQLLLLENGRSDRLWLAVNDNLGEYDNNQGSFSVRIEHFGGNRFDSAAGWLSLWSRLNRGDALLFPISNGTGGEQGELPWM